MPTCGNDFDETVSEDDISRIMLSAQAEIRKIEVQSADLDEAIADLEASVGHANKLMEEWETQLRNINSKIDGDIKNRLKEVNAAKEKVIAKQSRLLTERLRFDARRAALTELGALKKAHDDKQAVYELARFEDELGALTKEIETILSRWGYPNHSPTTFSSDTRDIVIGGKPRGHFGKGYRAVGFSAFVIGLMMTLTWSARHPGFVVLDSPLTTYRKGDANSSVEVEAEDEAVSSDLMYAFYRDLSDYYQDRQIIVFDNQEPDMDLRPQMNYIHFSKNKNIGRYGFFPVS